MAQGVEHGLRMAVVLEVMEQVLNHLDICDFDALVSSRVRRLWQGLSHANLGCDSVILEHLMSAAIKQHYASTFRCYSLQFDMVETPIPATVEP